MSDNATTSVTREEFEDVARRHLSSWPLQDEMLILQRDHSRIKLAVVSPRALLISPEETESGKCVQCKHVLVNHVWIADVFYRNRPLGGHVWCPCKRCPCHRSWAHSGEFGFDIREHIQDMTRDEAIGVGVRLRT